MGFSTNLLIFLNENCPLRVEWLDPQVGLHDKGKWIIDARSYCYFSTITSERQDIVNFFAFLLMGDLLWIKCDWVWLIETFPTFTKGLIGQSNREFTVICSKQTISLFRHTMKDLCGLVWKAQKDGGLLTITICWLKLDLCVYLYKHKVCVSSLTCVKYSLRCWMAKA